MYQQTRLNILVDLCSPLNQLQQSWLGKGNTLSPIQNMYLMGNIDTRLQISQYTVEWDRLYRWSTLTKQAHALPCLLRRCYQ